jgi:alkyl hydroperoxide reductase subunit AhpF
MSESVDAGTDERPETGTDGIRDVVVIGSGPADRTAALCAAGAS